MQGLWLTSACSVLLLSACAQEKFRDQVQQTQTTPSRTVVEHADQYAEKMNEEDSGSIPAETQEEMAESQSSSMPRPIFADCDSNAERPIVGELYELSPNTKALPDFKKMKAIRKVCLAQLDIKTRNFSEGFPGVEKLNEWFSLDMRFAVKIPESGSWEFKLVADDGAVLYIDQSKVIDNDGLHETREKNGQRQLNAGEHAFRVSYFQGPRYSIALELYWKGPQDTEFSYIPAANLMRPASSLVSEME
jgi:hypothetical protein